MSASNSYTATLIERPILFSGPMVRAILEGRKSQTRRLVKPQPAIADGWVGGGYWERRAATVTQPIAERWSLRDMLQFCPYGQPGDRLWVRETFFCATGEPGPVLCHYRADHDAVENPFAGLWKPSIFMPRWASRLVLEVTAVRVERLQDIHEHDAIAEGVMASQDGVPNVPLTRRSAFQILWDSLNAKRAPWSSNPWVWVVEFKRQPATQGEG